MQGPYRVACRLLMILLSQHGWPAAQIAQVLGVDPSTVRRWIHRYQQHGVAGCTTGPAAAVPDRAARGLASAS